MTAQPAETESATWAIVGTAQERIAIEIDAEVMVLDRAHLAAFVASQEATRNLRWVWSDTATWYPPILAEGVTVRRAYDLRLCHAILRDTMLISGERLVGFAQWNAASEVEEPAAQALFDVETVNPRHVPHDLGAAQQAFAAQRALLDAADGRLRLLTAAESAGALIAAEMRAAGLPWSTASHERLLQDELGTRDATGQPGRLSQLATQVRSLLGDASLSLDSQPKLLRGLHRAGILVESTSKWELSEQTHPVIAPLLEYKRLSRLQSANGWAWLAEWVRDDRFRPVYVPGGVVTGRWASSGGGALQIPRQLRTAVRADASFKLVIADVAQLEPRVLAAMSRDTAMAKAAYGRDLYQGLVDTGVVGTRQEAKIAVLGAMYGSTTGEAGRLVPKLRRAFPQAMGLVDDAARTGEQGGVVSTLLGRTSPAPGADWRAAQAAASEPNAGEAHQRQARRWAAERGRFTRNFVVQGTAAEWALAWLAEIRTRLAALPDTTGVLASASGPAFRARAHLAFFLHDEVILHVPASLADDVVTIVTDAATAAGRLLFGSFPVDFRLDTEIRDDAAKE